MMRKKWGTVVILGMMGGAWPGAWAQPRTPGPVSDQYIERQRQHMEENLRNRIAEIEQRFAEEQSFRVKMKEQRVAFERKLAYDRKAFLESLKKLKLAERAQALQAYYARQREKRKGFNEERRAESRKFWEARLASRGGFGAPAAGNPGK